MNYTIANIGVLQKRLNELVTKVGLGNSEQTELYSLSQELDELIVKYYKEN
ncbi:MAG: aspartyl-phosphate phosphatase Spo0E family protein [Cellulosilyticaceae bacterium]